MPISVMDQIESLKKNIISFL